MTEPSAKVTSRFSSAAPPDLLKLLVSRLEEFAVLLLDPDGNFISWHPGVEKQFGYSASEFVGRNGDLLVSLADQLSGLIRQKLHSALENGRALDSGWLVRKGGERVFVEGVILPLHDPISGKLLGFGKVLHNVTERKKADEDRKTLARTLEQSVVFIRSMNGTIQHWTSGCQRLYGWSTEETVGRSDDELLKTVYPDARAHIHELLLTNGTWQGVLEQKRRDGTPVYVSANWVAVIDENDEKNVSVISTHTDVTSRLQMQKDLETANRRLQSMALELERSNQELEEFARIASHDLSAPITSTRWLVDLLTLRHIHKLDEEGKKCLEQIATGLARMTDLVEAVLAHAQVGTAAIQNSEALPAENALDIAIGNLQKDIKTSNAVITHGSLPQLLIREQPLVQLFQNLLSNAIKYRRPEVQPEICISASRQKDVWLIEVQDNGSGIEPEWFERIFQPMQRRHSREVAGSGIGLATCKKIVTRAAGTIGVRSLVGAGSIFFFTLPGPE